MGVTLPIIEAPGVFGMRNSTSFPTEEIEPSYRRAVFELDVNADTLVAMLASKKSRPETNPTFKYAEQMPHRGFTTCAVYKDQLFAAAYTTETAAAGTDIFIKVPAAFVPTIRKRNDIMLGIPYKPELNANAKVVEVKANGANSLVVATLMEATAANELGAMTELTVIGNTAPEGGFTGDTVAYSKTIFENYHHIIRNTVKLTRNAILQKQRFGDGSAIENQRRMVLKDHLRDMNRELLFSKKYKDTVDGEDEYHMQGILDAIQYPDPDNPTVAGPNVRNFYTSTDSDYASYSWALAGKKFLDDSFQQLFTYGPRERTCLCGNEFLAGINKVAEINGNFDIVRGQTEIGMAITRWITPFGTVYFKTIDEFVTHPSFTHSGLLLAPDFLTQVVLTDSHLTVLNDAQKAKQGLQGFDGTVEEWLADVSVEINGRQSMMVLHGVGKNNITYSAS